MVHYELCLRLVVKSLDYQPIAEHQSRHTYIQMQTSTSWRLGIKVDIIVAADRRKPANKELRSYRVADTS